jgi:hypothetical protein
VIIYYEIVWIKLGMAWFGDWGFGTVGKVSEIGFFRRIGEERF